MPRRDQEPSGEPESLAGRLDVRKFGDRAMRTIDDAKQKRDKKRKEQEEKMRRSGAERQSKRKKEREA